MKSKILNLALILTSLIGYLEWGTDQHMFLFQGEYEILVKLILDTSSVLHPLILLPLLGQLLLVITLFQKTPGKILTYTGMAGIGLLLFFIFIISIISLNFKTMASSLPFLFTAFLVLRYSKKKNKTARNDR